MCWICPLAQILSIMRVPVREVLFKIILKIEINLKNASFPPGEVETSFELNEHWIIHLVHMQNFPKNFSYLLIRTRTCSYQGVRNVSFSENFCVRTKWMNPLLQFAQTKILTPNFSWKHDILKSYFFKYSSLNRFWIWSHLVLQILIECVFRNHAPKWLRYYCKRT